MLSRVTRLENHHSDPVVYRVIRGPGNFLVLEHEILPGRHVDVSHSDFKIRYNVNRRVKLRVYVQGREEAEAATCLSLSTSQIRDNARIRFGYVNGEFSVTEINGKLLTRIRFLCSNFLFLFFVFSHINNSCKGIGIGIEFHGNLILSVLFWQMCCKDKGLEDEDLEET